MNHLYVNIVFYAKHDIEAAFDKLEIITITK